MPSTELAPDESGRRSTWVGGGVAVGLRLRLRARGRASPTTSPSSEAHLALAWVSCDRVEDLLEDMELRAGEHLRGLLRRLERRVRHHEERRLALLAHDARRGPRDAWEEVDIERRRPQRGGHPFDEDCDGLLPRDGMLPRQVPVDLRWRLLVHRARQHDLQLLHGIGADRRIEALAELALPPEQGQHVPEGRRRIPERVNQQHHGAVRPQRLSAAKIQGGLLY